MSKEESKANELIEKYKSLGCSGCDMPYCDIPCLRTGEHSAKKMAVIAVDEILTEIEKVFVPLTAKVNSTYRFWQEVKAILTNKQ